MDLTFRATELFPGIGPTELNMLTRLAQVLVDAVNSFKLYMMTIKGLCRCTLQQYSPPLLISYHTSFFLNYFHLLSM